MGREPKWVHRAARAGLGLWIAGCSSSPAPIDRPVASAGLASATPSSEAAPVASAAAPNAPPASTPPIDPAVVTVTAFRKLPNGFTLDGDVTEWGTLTPPPQVEPKPKPGVKPEPVHRQPDGPSHLAFVLTPTRAIIAAEVHGKTSGNVWLGLRFPHADLPSIGNAQRGGGVYGFGDCTVDMTGQPLEPEYAAYCNQIIERHDKFVAAHEARFAAQFEITESGVSIVGSDGSRKAIAKAEVRASKKGDGWTVEVSVPLDALPMVGASPVTSAQMVGRRADAALHVPDDEWEWVDIGGVEFEPYPKLRSFAFELSHTEGPWLSTAALSYQPATPNVLELVSYAGPGGSVDTTSLEATTHVLYTKEQTIGSAEIGLLDSGVTHMVVVKNTPGASQFPPEMLEGHGPKTVFFKRPKSILLYTFIKTVSDGSNYGAPIYDQANIWVSEVSEDGTARQIGGGPESIVMWKTVSEWHSANLERYGMRGTALGFDPSSPPSAESFTWRFDKDAGFYAPVEKP